MVDEIREMDGRLWACCDLAGLRAVLFCVPRDRPVLVDALASGSSSPRGLVTDVCVMNETVVVHSGLCEDNAPESEQSDEGGFEWAARTTMTAGQILDCLAAAVSHARVRLGFSDAVKAPGDDPDYLAALEPVTMVRRQNGGHECPVFTDLCWDADTPMFVVE